jgi:hypothetical protein
MLIYHLLKAIRRPIHVRAHAKARKARGINQYLTIYEHSYVTCEHSVVYTSAIGMLASAQSS